MEPPGARRFRRLEHRLVLGIEVPVAAGPLARTLGLAWLHRDWAGAGLLLPRCHSVHTFGMRFALDLVFLDPDGGVIEMRLDVGPLRVVTVRAADRVLELPAGGRIGGLCGLDGHAADTKRNRPAGRL